jgi:uncharacterized membrane protein YhhN
VSVPQFSVIAPLVAAGTAATACLVFADYRKFERLRRISKMLAAAAFVAIGCLRIASGDVATPTAKWLIAALLLCAAGDACLLSTSPRAFLAGLASFAAGHIAYAACFITKRIHLPTTAVAFGAAAVLAALAIRWLWPRAGEMRGALVFYCVIIVSMFATACGAFGAEGSIGCALGAAAFAISDLSVARDQFIAREFSNRAWGLPLYFCAQYILTATI